MSEIVANGNASQFCTTFANSELCGSREEIWIWICRWVGAWRPTEETKLLLSEKIALLKKVGGRRAVKDNMTKKSVPQSFSHSEDLSWSAMNTQYLTSTLPLTLWTWLKCFGKDDLMISNLHQLFKPTLFANGPLHLFPHLVFCRVAWHFFHAVDLEPRSGDAAAKAAEAWTEAAAVPEQGRWPRYYFSTCLPSNTSIAWAIFPISVLFLPWLFAVCSAGQVGCLTLRTQEASPMQWTLRFARLTTFFLDFFVHFVFWHVWHNRNRKLHSINQY